MASLTSMTTGKLDPLSDHLSFRLIVYHEVTRGDLVLSKFVIHLQKVTNLLLKSLNYFTNTEELSRKSVLLNIKCAD